LNKAAGKGNEFAEHELGKLYIIGFEGELERETTKALKILTRLAENGNSLAQHTLGRLYLFGFEGIEKNKENGLYWLGKAIDQGNEYAKETLEFYQNHRMQGALSAAFKLIKESTNTVNNEINNLHWRNQIYTRSMSRQSIKEEFIHQRIE
jgi:TPR repeat protein